MSASPVQKIRTADDLKSAPDKVLISTLNDRYTKLNEVWADAEADLKQFPIPHYVEVIADDHDSWCSYLGFVKVKGAWRICWGSLHQQDPEQDYGWTPVGECTLDVRLKAVQHFVPLREKVRTAAEKTVAEVDDAISTLQLHLI